MTKRRKRHTPEQIVRQLRDADAMLNAGKELPECCRLGGQPVDVRPPAVRTPSRGGGRGGMKAEEAKRLVKELEDENRRLK